MRPTDRDQPTRIARNACSPARNGTARNARYRPCDTTFESARPRGVAHHVVGEQPSKTLWCPRMVHKWSPKPTVQINAVTITHQTKCPLTWCFNQCQRAPLLVGVLRHYSNRPDLLQQLQSTAVILSNAGRDTEVDTDGEASACGVIRSRRLRDRLSPDDVQAMIELYRLRSTARQVAEKFDVSLSSVKRLLRQHGVGREGRRPH